MSTTQCKCERPHIRKVKTSAFSVFGEGHAWMAAKPGHHYLVGHGLHFATWQDAIDYIAEVAA